MRDKKNDAFSWKGSYITINKKSLMLGIVIVLFFVVLIVKNSYKEESLLENGLTAKAYIYNIKIVGGKGISRSFYRFNVKGVEYNGFVDNENYSIGDSISILYKETKPSYNRDLFHLKNNY